MRTKAEAARPLEVLELTRLRVHQPQQPSRLGQVQGGGEETPPLEFRGGCSVSSSFFCSLSQRRTAHLGLRTFIPSSQKFPRVCERFRSSVNSMSPRKPVCHS